MKRTLSGMEAFGKMLATEIPEKTKTYTPISYMSIITRIKHEITNSGFKILDETYRCSSDGSVGLGSIMINYKEDPDVFLALSFTNSYNKQFAFKFSLGAVDKETSSNFIMNNEKFGLFKRKHKGTADVLAEGKIQEFLTGADEYWTALIESKDAFKDTILGRKEAQLLCANLFFEKDAILNTMQLNTIKTMLNLLPNYTHISTISLFDLHNVISHALKDSHPSEWLEAQSFLHKELARLADMKMAALKVQEVEDNYEAETIFYEDPVGNKFEVKDDTYRLPNKKEWKEAHVINVTDELP